MKAQEVAKVFEAIAPLDSGVPGDELGFIWGDPEIEVSGVGCMWCVHSSSIQYCIDHGINLIICHEALGLEPQTSPWYDGPDKNNLFTNQKRQDLLDKHGITVYRSHSNWDALQHDGIADSALAALGIDGLKQVDRQKFFSVVELPSPMTVKEMMGYVQKGLDFNECRIFGDANKTIRRFSFLIGGFGENQLHIPQAAMKMGAEAVIIGEMSEFIVMSCLEMGMPVIESLHSISEIPGIKSQAKVLTEQLPKVRVEYVPSGAIYF